ncbi:hypothetical protein GCM10022226_14250 [Sphaerisporangium flaviroseum]|uniref:Uncharacterized protein n=1 Tax=Sphaerisporangium flaviroseum TaxID=509199 RepID=A0ABP7HPC7_9ACTN
MSELQGGPDAGTTWDQVRAWPASCDVSGFARVATWRARKGWPSGVVEFAINATW